MASQRFEPRINTDETQISVAASLCEASLTGSNPFAGQRLNVGR
jgi:hypothetical protein